jgi:hypothetical protein
MSVNRVESGEDHGLDLFEARQRLDRGIRVFGDRVADLGIGDIFDIGNKEANFPGLQLVDLHRLRREDAERFCVKGRAIPHQTDSLTLTQGSLKDAGENDDAAVGVEPGIENQGLQVVVGRAFGWGNAFHDGFQDVGNAQAGLGADEHGVGGVQADGALDHFLGARNVGALQVDFVDNRDDLEPVIDRQVRVGQGLRLDTLRGIDDQ